jgi:hypothetical protein
LYYDRSQNPNSSNEIPDTPDDFPSFDQDTTLEESQDSIDPMKTSPDHSQLRRSKRIEKQKFAYANYIAKSITQNMDSHIVDRLVPALANAVASLIGEPGTDPSPFLPEPRGVHGLRRCPTQVQKEWIKAFVKEMRGLIHKRNAFKKEDAQPGEEIIPLMCVFKCKLDMFGLIEKLKARAVFRGDLHTPHQDIDSWNPHASFVGLKIFLAICAKFQIFPCQIDFIIAYLQATMKTRVLVELPIAWAEFLPEDLKDWCGRPLLLLKALYGYTYSGKFLYEDQADFLKEYGMRQTSIVALWVKHLPENKLLLVLQYSDDFLAASNDTKELAKFKATIAKRFDVEIKPKADWYLQSRIRQDEQGNIYLDQQRYSKSIVRRYLPNANAEPTPEDCHKYKSPLPSGFKFTKADNSPDNAAVRDLEAEFGYRYIEAVGSLNYLANTAMEELFAIRKLCRHMNLPGRNHFKALTHLIHHLRCHPTNATVFYKNVKDSPVYKMLVNDLKKDIIDPTLLYFSDASHGDCDGSKSTACYMGMFQGGIVDASSFVAPVVPNSTAESECIAIAVGAMSCAYIRMGINDILHNNPSRPWTVPFFSDSTSGIAMNTSEKPTSRSRHMDRRYFYGRSQAQQGNIKFYHIDGEYSITDIGTKNLTNEEAEYKLSVIEHKVSDHAIL